MGSALSTTISDPTQFATAWDGAEAEDSSSLRTYDYIVVGGGTAGCVLASRLSEDRNTTVLLIEAGASDGNIFSKIPLGFTSLYKTAVDWAYTTVPQKALAGREIYWPRGKLLGGTSVLNALIYHRSSPDDFDQWEKAGAKGWSYRDLEPYFRKAEGYRDDVPDSVKQGKGKDGPWKLGFDKVIAPLSQKVLETVRNIGVPYVEDLNANKPVQGVGEFTAFVDDNGTRNTTARAYLTPEVLARPNLTVAVQMTVEKILFTRRDPLTAYGVQLAKSSSSPKFRVAASKEVILCGGVVGSSQLLLLSGVGPKEELESVGIECIKNFGSVGKHLIDHPTSGPLIFRAKPGYSLDYLNSPLSGIYAIGNWFLTGSGPLSSKPMSYGAFLRSDNARFFDTSLGNVKDLTTGPESPDLELTWTPAVVPSLTTKGRPGEHGVTFVVILLQAESEGSITLRSNNPWDYPIINSKYLSTESDVDVILRGVRFVMRIAQTEPLRSLLDPRPEPFRRDDYFWPGNSDPEKITDDELRAWIRRNGYPACHPAGTCRMGSSPETSVVDPQLRVHGISGLRVMDASVFPTHVSGHPVGPIVAMAEKLADMIKASEL